MVHGLESEYHHQANWNSKLAHLLHKSNKILLLFGFFKYLCSPCFNMYPLIWWTCTAWKILFSFKLVTTHFSFIISTYFSSRPYVKRACNLHDLKLTSSVLQYQNNPLDRKEATLQCWNTPAAFWCHTTEDMIEINSVIISHLAPCSKRSHW